MDIPTQPSDALFVHPPTGVDFSPESQERLEALGAVQETVQAQHPEIIGLTCYGSTARGEAGPDSDVDVFALVEVDPNATVQNNPRVDPADRLQIAPDDQPRAGTYGFHGGIDADYKMALVRAGEQQGLLAMDIDILPISPDIVDDQATQLLEDIRQGKEGTALAVPRNIRSLFHLPVGETKVGSYAAQVINKLASDPAGEESWHAIRHMVVGFENGRDKQGQEPSHRQIPKTLAEAQTFYAQ